jgi:hypothetical protein
MESDQVTDELDGFMPGLAAKKLKPDNPDKVYVIESDLETDFDPDRGVLRSASSDSDWEEEIRYVPSSVGGNRSAGFCITSNGSGTYQTKTPGRKVSHARTGIVLKRMDRAQDLGHLNGTRVVVVQGVEVRKAEIF